MIFTKVNSFVRKTTIKDQEYFIGKDSGTLGNVFYYYIETQGKVISHGHLTLKEAKRTLQKMIDRIEG